MSDTYKPGDAARQRARGDRSAARIDKITRELREDGWYPRKTYLCGCWPERLCAIHAEQRAIDHYGPESAS